MTSYKKWKRSLAKLSEEQMFPLTVECELTSKCNFSCEMCYVKDNQSKDALSLEKWYQLFDEAIEAGALFFVLTGGEPLSHPNFWKIYRYLADKGVKITVFTNGSFLDELAVSRFTKNPPEMIVISLYGHNQETVSKFTKVSNAFALVDKGIDLLRNANIPFILRTLPVVSIYNQLPELIEYVRSKNQFLGYQLYLAPGKNQKNPHSLRLNPVQLYNFEQLLLKSFSQYQLEDCQSSMTSSNCQALRTGCYITAVNDESQSVDTETIEYSNFESSVVTLSVLYSINLNHDFTVDIDHLSSIYDIKYSLEEEMINRENWEFNNGILTIKKNYLESINNVTPSLLLYTSNGIIELNMVFTDINEPYPIKGQTYIQNANQDVTIRFEMMDGILLSLTGNGITEEDYSFEASILTISSSFLDPLFTDNPARNIMIGLNYLVGEDSVIGIIVIHR